MFIFEQKNLNKITLLDYYWTNNSISQKNIVMNADILKFQLPNHVIKIVLRQYFFYETLAVSLNETIANILFAAIIQK